MNSWDPTSPEAWARALGMVPVALFGRGRDDAPPGLHHALLDGPRASGALSIVDSEDSILSEALLSWSWSSNLRHSLTILRKDRVLLARRWDDPGSVSDWPLPTARGAMKILDSLTKIPEPVGNTVIHKLLDVFWTLRANMETRRGSDADLIRTFNSLLVWADTLRRRLIDPEIAGRIFALGDVLSALREAGYLDYGPGVLSGESVRSFDIGNFTKTILDLSPSTGIVLDPDLFIRHASGVLYEAAHIRLPVYPPSRPTTRQTSLFGDFTIDPIQPRAEPNRDAHFTPPSLARALVQEAIRESRAIQALPDRLDVMDPACGSGVFLVEALREIGTVENHGVALTGMDRSDVSCIMTEFCLDRLSPDGGTLTPSILVIEGDSLKMERWNTADIILMNPPFISWGRMRGDDQQTVKRVLRGHYSGRPDYSTAFISKAVESLKPGAILASIVPASFMESKSALSLRESISRDPSLSVRVLGRLNYNIFRNAEIEPAFLVIRRANKTDGAVQDSPVRMVIADKDRDDAAIRAMKRHPTGGASGPGWEIFQAPLSWLPEGSWMPRPRRALEFVRHAIEAGLPRVGDLFQVRLGIRTGANRSFLLTSQELDRLAPSPQNRVAFRPVADCIRDGLIIQNKYVFYPYGDDGAPLFDSEEALGASLPEYYSTKLLPNKDRLVGRRSVRNPHRWWELSEPRLSWLPPRRPKIVTQSFGRRGNFAFDSDGRYAVVQGNAWFWRGHHTARPNLFWAYLALLNSSVFEAILSFFCPRKQRPQYELYWKYSKNIIIPNLTSSTISPSIVGDLSEMGRSIAAGAMPDGEEMDRVVASAYRFPLPRIREALLPGHAKEIRKKFAPLAAKWKRETAHLSNVLTAIEHPAYQEIIALGEAAIAPMLEDLRQGPCDWFPALAYITGTNPVDQGVAGDVREMARSWLIWGEERGYI